ncbi:hypothetical protein L6452_37509 [Arctium lappa]|uniref:Uncharacterized protein n=1 Tax=Arctium lappa TaxID=4217 RepID=A0ACB8Y7C0_ARCLA|nr:hypothetical protein L6452_37509 [Arctium lappa]
MRPDFANRSHSRNFSSSSFKESTDRAEKYKAKYKREKKKNETLLKKGKGQMTKTYDWVDEPTSESEKDISNICLMAKINDVEDPEGHASSTALVSAECSSFSSQVHSFHSLIVSEKIEAFDSLTIDFYSENDVKKKV